MVAQRLHSALAPIDVLTRVDLEAVANQYLEEAMRTKLRGMDDQRFPRVTTTATSSTIQLFANPNEAPCGPANGDIWMVRRIIVKSSVNFDAAKYTLYRGTTPSDTLNSYGINQFLEGFVQATVPPSVSSPAIGTSPSTYVNTNNTPVNVSVTGGTVSLIQVNGQTLTGITSGTFTIQPGQYITVTYSVAPAFSVTSAIGFINQGLNVNIGFYPSSKAIMLQSGEQIYAQILGGTATNQYQLDGEAIRVPAEMKGKILGG